MPLKSCGLLTILSLFVLSCSSHYVVPKLHPSSQPSIYQSELNSTQVTEYEDLREVEKHYGLGVDANREARWLDAQDNFEKALEILGNLDIDEEGDPQYAEKVNTLLREIAQEYKVTLISLGTLDSQSSISAFLERYANIENFKSLKKDTTQLVTVQPDTVTYDLPIEWNERVENCIIYFQTIAREPFNTYLKRSGKYIDLMKEILREKGLPTDLAYLPMIESGYNPKAYSWARAVGYWQFISSTARLYKLKRNWWYDERRDFVKSTYAAADYLKFLYDEFGSWQLALAAYNCGEGNMRRAIKKYKTNDFWELQLKKQTADYVPLYMAATIIAKDPSRYGFGDVELEKPIQYEVVEINDCLDLKSVAQVLDVPTQTIRDLNPEILRDVTPPKLGRYALRIPTGTGSVFKEGFVQLPEKNRTVWIEHRIEKGETVSSIAEKYKIAPLAIIDANDLGKRHKIIAGGYLKIPATYRLKAVAETRSDDPPVRQDRSASKDVFIYTVRKGDTLLKIAQKFGMTIAELSQLNNLRNSNHIVKGRKLKVMLDRKSGYTSSNKKDNLIVHVVGVGETLWGIAVNYGVSLEKILKWNRLKDPSYIQVGDKIRIYQ